MIQQSDRFPAVSASAVNSTGDSPLLNLRILVVDDDHHMAALMSDVLEEAQLDHYVESNSLRALSLLEDIETPPRVIVSDIMMPELNGLELIRRAARTHSGLRVLFVSGVPSSFRASDLPAGVVWRFLPKPFHIDIFMSHIHELLKA